MESILNYYTSHWNPAFSGDTDLLSRKISLACDVVSNSINKQSMLDVPYYLIENVKKAVCAQADSFGVSLASPSASPETETSAETETETETSAETETPTETPVEAPASSESSDYSIRIGNFSYSSKSSSSSKNSSAVIDSNGSPITESLYYGENLTLCPAAKSYLINTGLLYTAAVVA